MNLLTTSHIAYRVKEHVEMRESEDNIIAVSSPFQITFSHLSPTLRAVMMMLAQRACSVAWINTSIMNAHGEDMITTFYRYISSLLRHQMIDMYAEEEEGVGHLATLIPMSAYFQHRWAIIQADQSYQVSRFAYVRRDRDGLNYLESPLSHARLRLDSPVVASIIHQLSRAMTPSELVQAGPAGDLEKVMSVLELLVIGNFVFPTTSDGRSVEEDDETLMQWEFHDLLFHSRCRIGRHNNASGGTYRFLERIPPQPAVKQGRWPVTIPLPQPDMDKIRATDPGLSTVMDARVSVRNYDQRPITLTQLAEFLYRVARIEEVRDAKEVGDLTKRPYPNGGAEYEIELYLTIDRCEGLGPGFYWYDPLHHRLSFIQGPGKDTERLLQDAYYAIGSVERPQIVITLAARFQRVSWKYESVAYSLILKDVGVMYSTMYLVATAMKLAPCAVGFGDSDLFAQLSGQEYLQETAVGEFVLGSRAVQTA